jgi:hypothetical protein
MGVIDTETQVSLEKVHQVGSVVSYLLFSNDFLVSQVDGTYQGCDKRAAFSV